MTHAVGREVSCQSWASWTRVFFECAGILDMAHLPQDQLPSEFDVVVDGTGRDGRTVNI